MQRTKDKSAQTRRGWSRLWRNWKRFCIQQPAPVATVMRCGLICIWVICKYPSRLLLTPRTCRTAITTWVRFTSHDRFGLWQLGVNHVLNAAHGKLCCRGNEDFYGTTVKYFGVPANDLPTFDLSPFFYPAAEFIHQALTSGGKSSTLSQKKHLEQGLPRYYVFIYNTDSSVFIIGLYSMYIWLSADCGWYIF